MLGPSPEVLTSSAASSVSNQALRGVAAVLQQRISGQAAAGFAGALRQPGVTVAQLRQAASAAPPTVRVRDVVALSADDPNGAGLAGASFPLVLGGMLGGVLISLLVVGAAPRVLALLVYGAAAGAAVTLVLQTWLHVLQRDWLANAAAFGLAMSATAAVVVGFSALIGRAGIGLGAVLSLLVGNPISGATLPSQFLAEPWGTVGQYLVPGAASTLVRSLSYFPLADTAMQWGVLGAWAGAGLLLTVLGHFRSAAPLAGAEAELERA